MTENLSHREYGSLIVLEYDPRTIKSTKHLMCRCKCGTVRMINKGSLLSGHTTTCGCSKNNYALGAPKTMVMTGKSRTPEYTAWIRMRRSCYDTDYKDYERYGARGISVCDEWIQDFQAFLAHVGTRPSKDHSIDRYPNNDGNYEPGNVRWADKTEQARNRRSSKLMTLDGITKSMVEWSEEFGIRYSIMKSRVRHGWSLARIKATPELRQK